MPVWNASKGKWSNGSESASLPYALRESPGTARRLKIGKLTPDPARAVRPDAYNHRA